MSGIYEFWPHGKQALSLPLDATFTCLLNIEIPVSHLAICQGDEPALRYLLSKTKPVNTQSILSLLSSGARMNDQLRITAGGADGLHSDVQRADNLTDKRARK